jgi:hypothetical protein
MIKVQIIGAQIACSTGLKDSWRELAAFVKGQLSVHFPNKVEVEYFDLFDERCPSFPKDAQIPVVLIDGELFSNGGKIAIPRLTKYLEVKLTE